MYRELNILDCTECDHCKKLHETACGYGYKYEGREYNFCSEKCCEWHIQDVFLDGIV